MSIKKENKSNIKEIFYYFALVGQLGIVMLANIFVAMGIYWLISLAGFKSILLLVMFIILGVFSGFYSLYKLIMKK